MSKLERTWWFSGLCLVVAVIAAVLLFQAAGHELPFGRSSPLAAYAVFMLCVFGLQRAVSIASWFLLAMVSPKLARGQA